ncbi:MAG: DUF4142 domain-containing protein [Williamsia sp.]|nr:DUF4142 domain-containing protein [Williamsia sp.]
MNVKKAVCFCFLSAATVLTACDKDDDNTNQLSQTDRDYFTQAALSNLAEIDAGQLAATKGNKDSVKMYGTMMVAEHTKANASLDSLAKTKGVTLPTTVDAEHVALKQRLSGYTGRTFDTAYINAQVKDHAKTVSFFQNEIANGQHQDVKNFANKLLPNIQMHLTLAQTIQQKL